MDRLQEAKPATLERLSPHLLDLSQQRPCTLFDIGLIIAKITRDDVVEIVSLKICNVITTGNSQTMLVVVAAIIAVEDTTKTAWDAEGGDLVRPAVSQVVALLSRGDQSFVTTTPVRVHPNIHSEGSSLRNSTLDQGLSLWDDLGKALYRRKVVWNVSWDFDVGWSPRGGHGRDERDQRSSGEGCDELHSD